MPLADDHYTARQPLRNPLRHAPSTPLLQNLSHPSLAYTVDLANRYNPRPPSPDHYAVHKLRSSTVHWEGVPHHRLPALALPGSSNASAYGDPHMAALMATSTSFTPELERERNRWRINPANQSKHHLHTEANGVLDGAGDLRKLLPSLKSKVGQDLRRVLGRRQSEAALRHRQDESSDKTPLSRFKKLLPNRARTRREEEEARRKETEAFLRSGRRNAGHARIIQMPPHHHMNPEDSMASDDGDEYYQPRTEAEIAEDRRRVGEFLFGDRPTLHLTDRRNKHKRATGVSDSIVYPYLHQPIPISARKVDFRRPSLPAIPRTYVPRKLSLGGGRYPRLEKKLSMTAALRDAKESTSEPPPQLLQAARPAYPQRKYSGTLKNSRRRSVTWKQPTVESQTQGSEAREIRSVTSSASYNREQAPTRIRKQRSSKLKPEEERPSPLSSQSLASEPELPEFGHRAEARLQESNSFWDTADSLLPYAKSSKTYKDALNAGNTSFDFWDEADQTLELPAWRQFGTTMDQWLENLPSWEDGFLQEFTERVKIEEQEHLTAPPANQPIRNFQRQKSDALRKDLLLHFIQEESTLTRSDADTPISGRDRLLKPSKPLIQPPASLQNDNNAALYLPPSPPKTGANSAEVGAEGLSSGEIEEINQSLVNKLTELERKWKSEVIEMSSVMKRMLYVIDKLVLDDFAKEQRRERGCEMGWGK